MPSASQLMPFVAGAVIAALVVFSAVVLIGTRIVRWLGLPQELPEGPRFEPPPPAAVPLGDAAAARARAAAHTRIAAVRATARATLAAAQACHELLAAALTGPQRERVQVAAQAAAEAAAAAELAMVDGDIERAQNETARQRAVAEAALADARAAAPGSASERRVLLFLLVGLFVVLAFLVATVASRP